MNIARIFATSVLLMGSLAVNTTAGAQTIPDEDLAPPATCGPGDNPEDPDDIQGRVPPAAYEDGVEQFIITCNTSLVGRHGTAGGYKVHRFVDDQGQECAYYDTTMLFGADLPAYAGITFSGDAAERRDPGTYVLDMTDPANPVHTATLLTPAFQSPHESMLVHEGRGLLMAVLGNPVTYPGQVDIYDLNADCTQPALQSSLPMGILGHESGISPDGNTLWVGSLWTPVVAAVDISNPLAPRTLWTGKDYISHGIEVSPDGNRAYLAWEKDFEVTDAGLMILDVTDIQNREPIPEVSVVNITTWDNVSVPQMSIHVTFDGVPHLIQMDEFGLRGDVGAARIIDLSNELEPEIVGSIRLEANQNSKKEELADDPGFGESGGYTGHYCSVETDVDPELVACTFIASGLRLFDIRDFRNPQEVAYFNVVENGNSPSAFSSIGFDTDDGHLWYSDSNTGFWVVDVNDAIYAPGGATFAGAAEPTTSTEPAPEPAVESTDESPAAPSETLPATGGVAFPVAVILALGAAVAVRLFGGRPGRR